MNNNLPPHDIEAEQSVLGSMIMDKDATNIAISLLGDEDFYSPENAIIFKTLMDMDSKDIEIDLITLKSELEKKGYLSGVGGIHYIGNIANGVPTSAHIKHYAKIVQEMSFRRKCIKNAEELKVKACDSDYASLIQQLELTAKTVIKNDDITALPTILESAMCKVHEHIKSGNKLTGLSTGFIDIDMMLGGLQDTDYVVIAGRPSMGKTAFALSIAKNATKKLTEKIVVIFSLEMSKEKLAMRLFSSELRIKNERFKFGTLDKADFESIEEETPRFNESMSNMFIDDNSSMTVQDMYAKCHTLKSNTSKDIGLIVIDYVQLMHSNRNMLDRAREVGEISRDIKKLAKDFNCPVIALSQLSRATEARTDKRPMLSDLRESGAIEQDADVVMMLYRDDYYNPDTEDKNTEVNIAKHRDGATGTVEIFFLKEYASFTSAVPNPLKGWKKSSIKVIPEFR